MIIVKFINKNITIIIIIQFLYGSCTDECGLRCAIKSTYEPLLLLIGFISHSRPAAPQRVGSRTWSRKHLLKSVVVCVCCRSSWGPSDIHPKYSERGGVTWDPCTEVNGVQLTDSNLRIRYWKVISGAEDWHGGVGETIGRWRAAGSDYAGAIGRHVPLHWIARIYAGFVWRVPVWT